MRAKGARRYLEQGVAIITVLLVLSILAVIGLGVATMGQRHMALTVMQANSEKAYMAAEAAALYACDVLSYTDTPPSTTTQVDMAPGSVKQRALSATSPDTFVNATTSGWASSGVGLDFKPPNSQDSITVPPEHIYVVGCGNVNGDSLHPTIRYVGLMCSKATPGGVYYFGAYAKNQLSGTNQTNGVVDAYDSKAQSSAPYSAKAADRKPYVDIVGATNRTNVAGMQKLFGNVDGQVVNATGTNFNNMGTARQPGISIEVPAPPWPALAPSPGTYDIQIGGSTKVYLVNQTAYAATHGGTKFAPPPPGILIEDQMHYGDLEINGSSQLIVIGTAGGGNYCVNSLFAYQGDVIVNTTEMNPTDHIDFYVNKAGTTNKNLEFTDGAKIMPVDADATRNNQPKFLNFYFNGDEARVVNSTTNVIGTITAANPKVQVELNNGAHLTGSVLSANNISMTNDFNLHYDVTLKKPIVTSFGGTDPSNPGAAIGIVSHQRL